eukprot:1394893-Amorphochlora_amoeboformis.AAC.1
MILDIKIFRDKKQFVAYGSRGPQALASHAVNGDFESDHRAINMPDGDTDQLVLRKATLTPCRQDQPSRNMGRREFDPCADIRSGIHGGPFGGKDEGYPGQDAPPCE